jgi:hypothetical protein
MTTEPYAYSLADVKMAAVSKSILLAGRSTLESNRTSDLSGVAADSSARNFAARI